MEKEKTVPSIRFKNFKEEWYTSKLSELCDIYDGTHQTPNYKTKGVPFLSVENIKDLKSNKYISLEDFYKNFKIYPQKNDILMTRIGDIGTTNVVPDDSFKAFYVSLALLKSKSIDSLYLNYSLNSNSTQKGIRLRSLLTAIPMKINKDQIGEVSINYPIDKNEQNKIGEFFNHIDSLINYHQSKYEKLIKYREALTNKLYPNNNNKPEIRFKGYNEEWNNIKLLDSIKNIVDYRGRTPKKLGYDWSNKGILALSALNVKMGYIDKKLDAHFGDEKLYDMWMKNTQLHKGQVLMTTEAPTGNVAQIPDEQKYILSQRTIAFEVKSSILSDDFLADVLSSSVVQKKLNGLSTGGTAKGVSQRTLSEIEIKVPNSKEEQEKISALKRHIDRLVRLYEERIIKLTNIKKSMLNKIII